MKLEELRKMESGDELNALVAEVIFGFKHVHHPERPKAAKCYLVAPQEIDSWLGMGYVEGNPKEKSVDLSALSDFSSSWAGMGLVIDAMTERDMPLRLYQVIPNSDPVAWQAEFGFAWGHGDTAPHAVCIAALVAVGAYDEYEAEQAQLAQQPVAQSYAALPLAEG